MNRYEKEFYDALKDLFIGEEIEGKSGYVNLMRIKSAYYTKTVQTELKELIEDELVNNNIEDFREELFEKLYTFFKRYFSDTGSIYYTYTPWSERIYERVYDPEKDVILFWKTHMLYYVKTEKNYKSVEIKIKGANGKEIKFYFDVSDLEHQKANEKKEIMFEFKEFDTNNRIVLRCIYSERGRKTKIDEIVKQAKELYKEITTEDVEKAIRIFNKQSEVDYFINKDAEGFLKEQLDMYVYQYMFDSENIWSVKRVKEIQVFKKIASKIIEFIAQFENELVKIWNKPKFVFNSNYVITIDRIVEKECGGKVLEKILNHENIDKQIEEWKGLGIVDDEFKIEEIYKQERNDLFSEKGKINEKYKYLPIDTKYFKDIEIDILELFDNLDETLDGWLIKSENYQALNTILPKFREKVQTIYIDPPFNKEQEADYLYKVGYKDATWITMLENRVKLGREILNEKGSIFVRCDYNGNMYVRMILNKIFGGDNFRNEINVSRISKQDRKVKKFNTATDSLYFYSSSDNFFFRLLFKKLFKTKGERWHAMDSQGNGNALYIFGVLLEPPKGRHWTYGQENIKKMEKEKRIRIKCKKCGYNHIEGVWKGCPQCGNKNDVKVEYLLPPTSEKQIDSNWTDISGYTSNWNFSTENSEILLKRVIESTSNEGDLILDFFLGSGTTTAVAHKLKRKWIGVEMGEHFWTVVLPRMKKVLFYDKSGISKEKDVKEKYNEKSAGGFFKYYELEQYENVLKNAKYEHGDLTLQPSSNKDVFNEYIFMRSPKFVETVLRREGNDYKVDLSKLYPEKEIDIVETLSNVLGKKIKKIRKESFELEDIGEIRYDNIPVEYIKPLIWW
ncbi:DNA methylase [Thermosipho melanesiensis]|uniref:DNA methylase N-4/N-6 domain protein n=2 Tax=Thermosipho melanesiensis TaxID=46541 RepID=A6LNN2_THEM4|nr:site-specific DNA-methyltransferase [Thermosipho melanesiensis]ABR31533.1 DNA methylase N-4/N-6 domain protein [Thermosipho melanesiensis BI429]APT74572.1 DNA methylase [Thermosipho melanesiensis]OOC35277.1 DNA methylase [Thermosipho melanesiensis]OOC35496.1 DNA methylase [Thermosipho melanesiensis]OOC36532.1 DNA methylase [Thermosipho melanesiensis]